MGEDENAHAGIVSPLISPLVSTAAVAQYDVLVFS
jgi:hypothetical protein